MNELIVRRIKEARKERGLTQQYLASYLNRTAASISDLERGKVQVSANDLYYLSKLLNKPIEYFYGEDYSGKDVQDLISIVRRMSPETRANQIPLLASFLNLQIIGDEFQSTSDKQEQYELAKKFYVQFVPLSNTMNEWIAQLNEIRSNLEVVLKISPSM
jgi:transcriptional regulator with XRE-family HTH domain